MPGAPSSHRSPFNSGGLSGNSDGAGRWVDMALDARPNKVTNERT